MRVKLAASNTTPSQQTDSPSPRRGGEGGSDWEVGFGTRPMKKMSLPHTEKWPQGGAWRLIGKDLLQLEAPPPPRGRSQGHAPSPQLPKSRAGEHLGTGNGEALRESILRLPPILPQKCTKPGLMPKCLGLGKGDIEHRDELPLQRDSLLMRGPQVSLTGRGMLPPPGRKAGGLRRRLRASSPPPRGAPPPAGGGAFVPHVEPVGPPGTAHPLPTHRAGATWGPGRKRPQPSSTWEGARDHRIGGIQQTPER